MLCLRGTCGRGTLRIYPLGRFPTHPFRVLGLVARGNTKGEFISCRTMGKPIDDGDLGDACFDSPQDFSVRGAIKFCMLFVPLCPLSKSTSFPLSTISVV